MNRRSWIGGAGDEEGIGDADERILSRVDENLYEYLKEADEVVMSPHANVSIRMEMTRVGNLDETVLVQDDVSASRSEQGKMKFLAQ